MKKILACLFLTMMLGCSTVFAVGNTLQVDVSLSQSGGEILLSGDLKTDGTSRIVSIFLMDGDVKNFDAEKWEDDDYKVIEMARVSYNGKWNCTLDCIGKSGVYLLCAVSDGKRFSTKIAVLNTADKNQFISDIGNQVLTEAEIKEFIQKFYFNLGLDKTFQQNIAASLLADCIYHEADEIKENGEAGFKQLADEVYQIVHVLNTVKDADISAQVYDVLYQNRETIGLDFTEYKQLSDTKKNMVLSGLKGVTYETLEDLRDAFEKLVEKAKRESNSGSAGGGGVGGSFSSNGNSFTYTGETTENTIINAEDNSKTNYVFNDIENCAWATEAICSLYEKRILAGYEDGSFRPDANVSREEFVKILVTAFEMQDESARCPFTDVDKENWSYPYVAAAYTRGMVQGVSATEFGFGEKILREDMAVMIFNALGAKSTLLNTDFADYDEVSNYARQAVSYLAENGIMNGTGSGYFEPKRSATRAECAKLIFEVLKRR